MDQSLRSNQSFHNSSELALQALSQNGCGALLTDTQGQIIYVNSRLCEITGYSLEDLIGQNPKILQSGNTPRETYLALWNTISSGSPWHGILQNRRKSGEIFWEALTISPIKSTNGEITHFAGIFEDITQEKLNEAADAQVNEEIFQEEKRESLTAMVLGMAHDLNNSFSCILAACDLANASVGNPEKTLEMLEYIKSAANRSADFLKRMVSLSRPSMPTLLTMDLAKVIELHLSHYRSRGGQSVQWMANGVPTPTVGNPALVHQAVLALLDNACETNSGKPIEISCGVMPRFVPEAEEFFLSCGLNDVSVAFLEVKDRGRGMDSYALRRACNPFYSTKSGHKGLGLPIVYGIMRSHKGAIGIVSSPDIGTRVRLYFPLVEDSRRNAGSGTDAYEVNFRLLDRAKSTSRAHSF